jgi:hypothetical protein
LIFILLSLFVFELDRDPGQAKELFRFLSGMVAALADDPYDSAIDQKHRTGATRCHPTVEGGSFDGDSSFCRLADRVLFGMNGPNTVLRQVTVFVDQFLELVAYLIAMRQALGRAYITRDEYLAVLRDDAAAPSSIARGSFGDCVGNLHEILIP